MQSQVCAGCGARGHGKGSVEQGWLVLGSQWVKEVPTVQRSQVEVELPSEEWEREKRRMTRCLGAGAGRAG